jgi:hypothetical protein
MKSIQCLDHNIEFQLPTTEEEFLLGTLHEPIEDICEHHERYSKYRFQEIEY